MANASNITAWILLITALYSIAAAIGELRRPGSWARMVWELEQSKALQFLTGILVLVMGAAVYLVNPYDAGNWVSVMVTVMGGLMMLEGIAFLAFSDWMVKLSRNIMGSAAAVWAWAALAIGLALIFISYVQFLAS